jgi:hypothetical protein
MVMQVVIEFSAVSRMRYAVLMMVSSLFIVCLALGIFVVKCKTLDSTMLRQLVQQHVMMIARLGMMCLQEAFWLISSQQI